MRDPWAGRDGSAYTKSPCSAESGVLGSGKRTARIFSARVEAFARSARVPRGSSPPHRPWRARRNRRCSKWAHRVSCARPALRSARRCRGATRHTARRESRRGLARDAAAARCIERAPLEAQGRYIRQTTQPLSLSLVGFETGHPVLGTSTVRAVVTSQERAPDPIVLEPVVSWRAPSSGALAASLAGATA